MTPQESITLVRYVRAACPQQAIDEYTPDAWHDLLGDLRFEDCRDAVRAVVTRQPFVAPAEVCAEVKRIRNARLDRVVLCPPRDCPDETAWLAAARRAVADGTWDQPSAELPPSNAVPRAIEAAGGAFQRVDP